uniref:tRNA pseudouridine(55) synthase n=1 Tax=Spongospora subterranea TaxID=70186 RepID=A0A0H5RC72_9EUKA|eukprot:CRZ11820.1 hypothetical protein [Spongospora subterranea]
MNPVSIGYPNAIMTDDISQFDVHDRDPADNCASTKLVALLSIPGDMASRLFIPDGLLGVYKAPNVLSYSVVHSVKQILRQNPLQRSVKVGHSGVLDHFAEGILVIGIGSACKRLTQILKGDKKYVVTGRFGFETDTLDISGNCIRTLGYEHITRDCIEHKLSKFIGNILQTPPLFSALKIQGKRSSDRVRNGEKVVLSPRPVVVHDLQLISYEPPVFRLEVHCGSGFYVRSLVRDIGESLGSCATAVTLCRTKSGPFSIPDSKLIRSDELTLESIFSNIYLGP